MNWRTALLVATGAGLAITALLVEPVAQDPAYHAFVDHRTVFGIPNFMNVASNLGFLIVGLYGMQVVSQSSTEALKGLRVVWLMLYIGVFATAAGSSWYHWSPANETLAWDRLGMVIGFMSLAALMIGEFGSRSAARKLLWPLLAIGIASVLYWSHTESLGRGDLRPYALVQFVPILLIPLTLLLYSNRSDLTRWFWWLIAFYLLAKLSEHFDEQLYQVGRLISGHSLKHLFAAVGLAFLFVGLRRREQ